MNGLELFGTVTIGVVLGVIAIWLFLTILDAISYFLANKLSFFEDEISLIVLSFLTLLGAIGYLIYLIGSVFF